MAGPSLVDRGPLVTTLALMALGLSVLNMATLLKHQFSPNEPVICRAMPFHAPSPPMHFEHEDGPGDEAPRRHRYPYDHHRHDHHWHEGPHGSARFQTLFLIESANHDGPSFEFFRCP